MGQIHCTPIKIQDFSNRAHFHYLGWAGALSDDQSSIEMSESLGRLLGFHQDMLISAQIEYSFEKLDSVELEPLTHVDFQTIEQHSDFIE